MKEEEEERTRDNWRKWSPSAVEMKEPWAKKSGSHLPGSPHTRTCVLWVELAGGWILFPSLVGQKEALWCGFSAPADVGCVWSHSLLPGPLFQDAGTLDSALTCCGLDRQAHFCYCTAWCLLCYPQGSWGWEGGLVFGGRFEGQLYPVFFAGCLRARGESWKICGEEGLWLVTGIWLGERGWGGV